MPRCLPSDCSLAVAALAAIGLRELPMATVPELVRSIVSIMALHKGARAYSRLLLESAEAEILDLEARAFCNRRHPIGHRGRQDRWVTPGNAGRTRLCHIC